MAGFYEVACRMANEGNDGEQIARYLNDLGSCSALTAVIALERAGFPSILKHAKACGLPIVVVCSKRLMLTFFDLTDKIKNLQSDWSSQESVGAYLRSIQKAYDTRLELVGMEFIEIVWTSDAQPVKR